MSIRIVCVSDTHMRGPDINVPDGDVLVHAGDHTMHGTENEMKDAFDWLASLLHWRKVAIAGNHDWFFDEKAPPRFRSWSLRPRRSVSEFLADYPGITYLEDSSVEIHGATFYGSPWQPPYCGWAFNFSIDSVRRQGRRRWAMIPRETEVLITHTPPYGICDWAYPGDDCKGDVELRARLNDLASLQLHVFGHLHESYGSHAEMLSGALETLFVNASINTRAYEPRNEPIVADLQIFGKTGRPCFASRRFPLTSITGSSTAKK